MKNKIRAYVHIVVFAILTVLSGLALVNNVSAVVRWWAAFRGSGGDATLVPDKCPGILPWLDWTAVDYSCATTLIPFLGFLLVTLGLARALSGKRQDPETFPFFKGYDQLNIAFGLIGTLWGIIIIGYFQMDSVTMGDLMMCLHTALFSTLMAVVWVFIADHTIIRPVVLDVLRALQGSEHEDEDILEVLDKLTGSAAGLCDVWNGNRDGLAALNDSISLASAELLAFGGIGKNVSDILARELTGAAQKFIDEMSKASEQLAVRQESMDAAMMARQAKLDASHAEIAALLGSVTGLISGIQSVQDKFAIAAEKLSVENAALVSGIASERNEANTLRGKVSELRGESDGRLKQISELIEQMRAGELAFSKRIDKLRDENETLSAARVKVEGEKQVALREVEDNRHRADRAEKLLEKIKSAFNV